MSGHKGEKGPPGLPGTVIYSDMQNLTNCACSGKIVQSSAFQM